MNAHFCEPHVQHGAQTFLRLRSAAELKLSRCSDPRGSKMLVYTNIEHSNSRLTMPNIPYRPFTPSPRPVTPQARPVIPQQRPTVPVTRAPCTMVKQGLGRSTQQTSKPNAKSMTAQSSKAILKSIPQPPKASASKAPASPPKTSASNWPRKLNRVHPDCRTFTLIWPTSRGVSFSCLIYPFWRS
jgi:hypothetical protein